MDRQRNPAVKWGLIFGGLLILVALINFGIEYATGAFSAATSVTSARSLNLGASLVQSCIVFLVEVALYFGAGLLAARENGRVGTGSVAGLIAGLLAGVVGAIITLFTLLNRPLALPAGSNITPATLHSMMIVIGLVGAILGFALVAGIGAGVGALGGLVGRGQYERAHPTQPMIESFYSPMPTAPGYPPTQGAYPPPAGYSPAPGAYPPPQQAPDYPPQYPPQTPPQYPPQTPPQYPQQ